MLTIDTRIQTDTAAVQSRSANSESNTTITTPQSTTNTARSQKAAGTEADAEFKGKAGLKETEEAIRSIQKDMELMNTRITFRVDNKTDEIVVDVIDKDTNEVIRQIPSEEMLRIKTAFKKLMKGLLLDTTV